jgi:uracil-DNA glycosylase family 4
VTWQTLAEARDEALGCTRCRLAGGRTQVVWMDGNPDSALMFVGEAPGFHEDRQGLPFVGAAGQLLDTMLRSIGLDRSQCTICNVIKCRPPGNRDPMPDEIESCRPFLEAQLRFIRPRVIVTLGNFATRFILAKQVSISRVRGQRFEIELPPRQQGQEQGREPGQGRGRGELVTVIPTFHPAAVLHGGGNASPAFNALQEDFRLIASVLAEPPPAIPEEPEPEETAEQEALF